MVTATTPKPFVSYTWRITSTEVSLAPPRPRAIPALLTSTSLRRQEAAQLAGMSVDLPPRRPVSESVRVITVDDYLSYVRDALDGMVQVVTELGDDLANRRPDLPGANSPYVILTHCLGVMEYWGGQIVAGRRIERDRDAEFRAAGSVPDLVERTWRARERFEADIATAEPAAPPRGTPAPDVADLPLGRTQGGALLHIYEELAQHRGQLEGCRDVLLAPWAKLV